MTRPDLLKRGPRPLLVSEYAPILHQAIALIESEGLSSAQAARRVHCSRSWLFAMIRRSRAGDAPLWIAQEWDRVRMDNQRCDLCSTQILVPGHTVTEGDLTLAFCSVTCTSAWVEAEEA